MNDAPKTSMFSKWMKILLIVLGLIVATVTLGGVGLYWSKSNPQNDSKSSTPLVEDSSNEQQSSETAGKSALLTAEEIIVETPFCMLYYPGKWGGSVRTETTDLGYGYMVQFYGTCGNAEAALFSVMFGFGSENAEYVGAIVCNGISTSVYVKIAVFAEQDSWTVQSAEQMRAMQADIEYLIEKMKDDPFFSVEEADRSDVVIPSIVDAVIDTPYGLLHYPGQWKDAVRWETVSDDDGYAVTFLGTVDEKEFPLFAFSFQSNTDNGFQVGTVAQEDEEIGVYLTLYDAPSEENWTEAQQHLFSELQDQAYYVLENLPDNPNYTSVID